MLWRLLSVVSLVAAGAAVPAAAAAPHPRIVAVGDLHGDFDAWRAIAMAAGVENAAGEWTGGRTILVQAGDDVDREPDSLKIIHNLMKLQKQAKKQGGRVIVLVGNHEAMNITGDLRYTRPGEFAAFATPDSADLRDRFYEENRASIEATYRANDRSLGSGAIRDAWLKATPLGWVEHRLAWSPRGEIGSWVVRNPAVALVDGNLFVHGGLSAEYADLSIHEINSRVDAALAARDTSPESIINDPLGPLWYRGLLERAAGDETSASVSADGKPRPSIDQELATVLAAYGAKRIVVAHTPVLTGIQVLDGGRLVRIDTGISRYYGGVPSWLEIVGDRLTPHTVPRPPAKGGAGQ